MWVFDIKIDKEEELNEAQKRASEIYDKQIKSLGAIIETDGYREIKSYFERERESAKDRLTEAKDKEILTLQAQYKVSNWFITFLNNFESKFKK